jgi:hypothetical protein
VIAETPETGTGEVVEAANDLLRGSKAASA